MSFKILKFVIRNPSGCSAAPLLGWQQPFERSPPKISWRVLLDLFCRYVLDFYSECPSTTPILARSRDQNVGLSSAADVCSRPASKSYTMACGKVLVCFLFQINWLFTEIVLPTLDQFKPSFKNGLFSFQRSCILHFSCQFSFSFLSPRRVSPVLAWGDFHVRSRFACSTTPEEKWETTRSLWFFASDQFLSLRWITLWTNVYSRQKPSTKYPAIIFSPPRPHI